MNSISREVDMWFPTQFSSLGMILLYRSQPENAFDNSALRHDLGSRWCQRLENGGAKDVPIGTGLLIMFLGLGMTLLVTISWECY